MINFLCLCFYIMCSRTSKSFQENKCIMVLYVYTYIEKHINLLSSICLSIYQCIYLYTHTHALLRESDIIQTLRSPSLSEPIGTVVASTLYSRWLSSTTLCLLMMNEHLNVVLTLNVNSIPAQLLDSNKIKLSLEQTSTRLRCLPCG